MLKFKSSQLKQQFYHLAQTDPRIRALAGELVLWVEKLFDKDIIITCVWRTEEEQRKIYGSMNSPQRGSTLRQAQGKQAHHNGSINSPQGGEAKPSAHFCLPQCRAVDIRAHENYFTQLQLENMESFVRKYFPRRDGLGPILFHGEGDNFHIHLSVEPLIE
jgi:hypothetical protein